MTVDTRLRAYAAITGSVVTFIPPDSEPRLIAAAAAEDVRQLVVDTAAMEARRLGAALELITTGDFGQHTLVIGEDGSLARATGEPSQEGREVSEQAPEQIATQSSAAPEPRARTSFIREPTDLERPESGWRSTLARLGIPVRASRRETERATNIKAVSQQWAGCRTIAVVNGKGGVGKTMTTAMISAVFARFGGGNVLAWDNNDTRGTLGWRTEQGSYDSTIRDLLPAATALLAPTASVSDIARFVHHQNRDRYDVLRSNPELLATDQRIDATEFDLLMQVAARYYRIVIFDSGNDESADRWLRMVDSSNQLVIPTVTSPESAESAALLLAALQERDGRSQDLAERAVVVVTQTEEGNSSHARRIVDAFSDQVRAVRLIPYDHALKSGALRLDHLRPATRDAWLSVAADVARGL